MAACGQSLEGFAQMQCWLCLKLGNVQVSTADFVLPNTCSHDANLMILL